MNRNYNPNMPPVLMNLLIINVLVFMATQLLPISNTLFEQFALFFPASPYFKIWQPLTHMFLHANFMHLFFNMFTLWMFGRTIENDLGSKRFLWYYFLCGFGAALLQLGVNWIEINAAIGSGNSLAAARAINTPMVGASGAIFGLLAAFGIMHGNSILMMLFPPIPMKAKYFVLIYAALELWLGVTDRGGGVAHFAHLGGALWGFLILLYWKKRGKIHY